MRQEEAYPGTPPSRPPFLRTLDLGQSRTVKGVPAGSHRGRHVTRDSEGAAGGAGTLGAATTATTTVGSTTRGATGGPTQSRHA